MDFGNYNPVLLDTNIDVGDQSTDFVTCGLSYTGTGLSMTYTLDSQTYGYDVTNITVYGGWLNGNRNEQEYQVLYSTVSAPSTFISLVTPDYKANDPSSGPSATSSVSQTSAILFRQYLVRIFCALALSVRVVGLNGHAKIIRQRNQA
jgi:hypothetical protein